MSALRQHIEMAALMAGNRAYKDEVSGRSAFRNGFRSGAEWAHSQRPTREQIARALMMRRGSLLIGTDSSNPSPSDYRDADAVLALEGDPDATL